MLRNPVSPASSRHAFIFLLTSAAVGYGFLTCLRNQDHNHVSGILPALAVLSGCGIARLLRARPQGIVLGLLAPVLLFQTVLATDPGLIPVEGLRHPVTVFEGRVVLWYPAQSSLRNTKYAYPDPSRWPLQELLEYVHQAARTDKEIQMGVIPDFPGIEKYALLFESYRLHLPIHPEMISADQMGKMDVLVQKTGSPGFPSRIPAAREITAILSQSDSGFVPAARTFLLPDDSSVVIYVRAR